MVNPEIFKRLRLERKKKGLCPRCGNKNSSVYEQCDNCRDYQRERYHFLKSDDNDDSEEFDGV